MKPIKNKNENEIKTIETTFNKTNNTDIIQVEPKKLALKQKLRTFIHLEHFPTKDDEIKSKEHYN
jgi:hypothetical protein